MKSMSDKMIFESLLAGRTKQMQANAIREILKVISQPGMISLAGGIPAPESFPLEIFEHLTHLVIQKYATTAFQYDNTTGFGPLKEALVDFLKPQEIQTATENILITSGSQGVLDGLGKIFISKGDKIAVEAPTYLGALSAFNPYEPVYISIETDDDGLVPDSLETTLRNHNIKLIYLVPTFQNPTGRTITLERRYQISKIIQKYNALLIEDDPYSQLRYRGVPLPTIKQLAPDHVVYVGSLSKIFAPGLRIGFCVAPTFICRWLEVAKQGVDLHTSTFNQALAAEYIGGGFLDQQLPKILDVYRPKQLAMLDAMKKKFPSQLQWSKPEGGMFIWIEGPKGINMVDIYRKAIERNTAFVPGTYFFINEGEGMETARLNYTMPDIESIKNAIYILSDIFSAAIDEYYK